MARGVAEASAGIDCVVARVAISFDTCGHSRWLSQSFTPPLRAAVAQSCTQSDRRRAAQSRPLDAPLPAMRVLLTSTLSLLLISAASALHASSLRVTPQRARARSITMMPIGVPKVNTRAPPDQNVG